MDSADSLFLGLILGFVAIIGVVIALCSYALTNEAEQCESAGGVYKYSRDGSLCLRPDAIIDMRGVK